MRIIIDSGVLWRPEVMRNLKDRGLNLVLPAVAYAERLRQLSQRRQDVRRFHQGLEIARITVEPFGEEEARRVCPRVPEEDWPRLARDAMIAGHVRRGDVLITTNPADFTKLGLGADQIQAI